MKALLSAKEVCDLYGIGKPSAIKTMRKQGLAWVVIGKAYRYRPDDVAAFIESRVRCPDQTPAPALSPLPDAPDSISNGLSTESAAFAQQALATANMLKRHSPCISGKAGPAQESRTA